MTHRVNVMLDDATWEALRRVPRGDRSRVVNAAIIEWFRSRRRASAARRMDELRAEVPRVTTQELVDWIRRDRERRS